MEGCTPDNYTLQYTYKRQFVNHIHPVLYDTFTSYGGKQKIGYGYGRHFNVFTIKGCTPNYYTLL